MSTIWAKTVGKTEPHSDISSVFERSQIETPGYAKQQHKLSDKVITKKITSVFCCTTYSGGLRTLFLHKKLLLTHCDLLMLHTLE